MENIALQSYARKKLPFSAEIVAKMVTFSSRNTNIYKFANFAMLYFPCFTTFRYQTWQSTNFRILFLTVVKYFVRLGLIESSLTCKLSIRSSECRWQQEYLNIYRRWNSSNAHGFINRIKFCVVQKKENIRWPFPFLLSSPAGLYRDVG